MGGGGRAPRGRDQPVPVLGRHESCVTLVPGGKCFLKLKRRFPLLTVKQVVSRLVRSAQSLPHTSLRGGTRRVRGRPRCLAPWPREPVWGPSSSAPGEQGPGQCRSLPGLPQGKLLESSALLPAETPPFLLWGPGRRGPMGGGASPAPCSELGPRCLAFPSTGWI